MLSLLMVLLATGVETAERQHITIDRMFTASTASAMKKVHLLYLNPVTRRRSRLIVMDVGEWWKWKSARLSRHIAEDTDESVQCSSKAFGI